MNWRAIGALVGLAGIAFAAGLWVNSTEKNLDDLTIRLKALENKPPPSTSTPEGLIAL